MIKSHPGKTILGEMLERDWKASELAGRLGLPLDAVRDLLMESGDVTPEIAAKLSEVLDISQDFWLRLQSQYDSDEPLQFAEPVMPPNEQVRKAAS